MSQTVLAERSGVPQSTISRLERGLVPRSAMFKIVLMADALGRHLPLAYCPHDHRCAWSRLGADGNRAESLVELELEAMGLGSRFDGL